VLLLDEPPARLNRAAAQTLYRALAEERPATASPCVWPPHQLGDAYRWADDVRALAEGRLSPVTAGELFRVELPASASDGDLKHVRVGSIEIAATTDKTGAAILGGGAHGHLVSREHSPPPRATCSWDA